MTKVPTAETWVDAHGDALYRYAMARLAQATDAEDLVQETLLAAIEAASNFRGDSAERTWLIGILRHKIADLRRFQEKSAALFAVDEDEDDDSFTDSGRWRVPPKPFAIDEHDLLERDEFWEQFRRCRAGLPTRQAEVFRLCECDEEEPELVCKQLGVSRTNLWVLLHRARLKLRACLEATWFRSDHR